MAQQRFDPPGFVNDLTDAQKQAWSNWVSSQLDAARDRGPRLQFFNTLAQAPTADVVEKDITWTAFPRQVKIASVSDVQRWKRADASRDRQDEYCEWSVTRDANGKITRVTFTSEAPEYWMFLAAVNPARVLQLYREHVNPAVQKSHLFLQDGSYIQRNRWNDSTDNGAMHLIQGANTLRAEIELAAAATVVRRKNGVLLMAERELIDCALYGAAERFSDPHIGAEVNALARDKDDISLANPVGLCIAGLSATVTQDWETKDGSDAHDFWRVTRGTPAKAVRAVYEVPAERGFTVGDIKDKKTGRFIEYGAQIADYITIKLTGLATRLGKSTVQPVNGCEGDADAGAVAALDESVPTVESVLNRPPWISR